MKRLVLVAVVLLLCGCTRTARLYNLDTGEMTIITASYRGGGGAHGTLSGTFKSGETIRGEYSVVTHTVVGWGSVYSSVYSGTSSATGNGTAMAVATGGKQEGSAVLTGDKGTVLDCEFLVGSNPHGIGACKDNHGGKYKMLF